MRVKGKFFLLGVARSLLPKTIRDAPHNREVNRKKNFQIALNTNSVDRSLITKRIHLYMPGVVWIFRCGI